MAGNITCDNNLALCHRRSLCALWNLSSVMLKTYNPLPKKRKKIVDDGSCGIIGTSRCHSKSSHPSSTIRLPGRRGTELLESLYFSRAFIIRDWTKNKQKNTPVHSLLPPLFYYLYPVLGYSKFSSEIEIFASMYFFFLFLWKEVKSRKIHSREK